MKKAISLVLVLAMLMALLASCGGGGESTPTAAPTQEPATQAPETQTPETTEPPADDGRDYDFNADISAYATANISSVGVSVHDPSILKVGDTYYIYGSHMASAKSTDLFHWEKMSDGYSAGNPIFGAIYDKYDEAFAYTGTSDSIIPTTGSDSVWAPDVKYNEKLGKYVMYYCTSSTFNASNLCYAFSDRPDGNFDWQGALIYSGFDKDTIQYTDVLDYVDEETALERYVNGSKGYNFEDWPNAIDPTCFTDADGKDWLVYGSWSGGIFLLELDPETGLVIHPEDDPENDVDAYFGKRLVGGGHESMEAPYILYDAESQYYYLFVSYGGLNREGGYQIRVFRSDKPDGPYVDMNGMNLGSGVDNSRYALKLSGNYMLPSLRVAYMATGHNSAFIDDDGKRYIVYHTRFNTDSEAHSPRVHQYLLNEDGWPCMLPYQTQGETVGTYNEEDVVGRWFYVNQGTYIGSIIAEPIVMYLNDDHTVKVIDEDGTWSMDPDSHYITITLSNTEYKGVLCAMKDEAGTDCMTFSVVGENMSLWGVKYE